MKKKSDLILCLSGYTETLDDSVEILVPDDDFGLYAIDILDPSWVLSMILSMDSHSPELM